jgi:hypothetical protein
MLNADVIHSYLCHSTVTIQKQLIAIASCQQIMTWTMSVKKVLTVLIGKF